MTSLVATVVAGVVFGVALAAPPGPMNAIIAEESVLRGVPAGVKAGLGAMMGDVVFFVLALAGVATLIGGEPTVEHVLYVLGGGLMLVFALDATRQARVASSFTGGADVTGTSTGFRKAFALSITNPYQIGFWLTVGIGLLQPGTLDVFEQALGGDAALAGALVVETGSPSLLLGFFGGIAVWIVVYPVTLAQVGRRVDALAPVVAMLSAVVLAGFGIVFLGVGIGNLL